MRERSLSSIGVVLVGLVPALVGGPIFALAFAAICALALLEYLALIRRQNVLAPPNFAALVPLLALATWLDANLLTLLGLLGLASLLPLVVAVFAANDQTLGQPLDWAGAGFGIAYLTIPVVCAVSIRDLPGSVERSWFSDLAERVAGGWDANPRGLAWLLMAILVTWIADTMAYLVGRSIGRRKLIPAVSPKKTVEGAIGGLAGAVLTAVLVIWVFGLGFSPLWGIPIGLVLGIAGQVGDLAESLIKRQVNVKDSGSLIPGHGGMLDRIDALIVVLMATAVVIEIVEGVGL